ncbi:MAG TPA: ABC transporter permease [Gaiellaceae bacterium]|jgi:ABC-type Na+ efflux pump permease subunit
MTNVAVLLRKDLTVLRRSPLLLVALLSYPIVIALLVGLVAGYANAKPRVAWVDEEGLPPVVAVGGHRFHIQTVIDQVSQQVTLVKLSSREAARELSNGKVVATITVPNGFLAELGTTTSSPQLVLRTTSGGLSQRVTEQVQSLVYQLNRKLQAGFIAANLREVQLLEHGGKFGSYDVLGLDEMDGTLATLPQNERVARLRQFVRIARLALAQTGNALHATANPISLAQPKHKGRTWVLSAQVQSYGIALTVTFLALLLAAGATAAERDEGTIGRLRRGLVSLGELVASKIALAAVVGVSLAAGIAVLFGIVVDVGGVQGGQPWPRLPLLLIGVALAAAVIGAAGALLGALARESRAASLLAVLIVLPVVFLGLVPRGALSAAYWVSRFLPFSHAVAWFSAALYDTSPWRTLGIETLWLLGIGAVLWLLARRAVRTLSA